MNQFWILVLKWSIKDHMFTICAPTLMSECWIWKWIYINMYKDIPLSLLYISVQSHVIDANSDKKLYILSTNKSWAYYKICNTYLKTKAVICLNRTHIHLLLNHMLIVHSIIHKFNNIITVCRQFSSWIIHNCITSQQET